MPIDNPPPSDPSRAAGDRPGLIPGTLEGKPIGWVDDEQHPGPEAAKPAKKPAARKAPAKKAAPAKATAKKAPAKRTRKTAKKG